MDYAESAESLLNQLEYMVEKFGYNEDMTKSIVLRWGQVKSTVRESTEEPPKGECEG